MCEQDRDIKEQKSWIKTVGPDCGNICDIIYDEMCGQCSKEYECHKSIDHCTPIINHEKMLDCVLKKLIIKSDDEIEDEKKINNAIDELEVLDFVKNVKSNTQISTDIFVTVSEEDFYDWNKREEIHDIDYDMLRDINVNIPEIHICIEKYEEDESENSEI